MQTLQYRLVFNTYQFIVDHKKVVDFALQGNTETVQLGDIYLAEVEKCDDQFCFLDIKQSDKLFIRNKDIKSTLNDSEIKIGKRLYVQVNTTRRADKWARASGTINLASANMVLTTDRSGLFISKKITDQAKRKMLQTIFLPLLTNQFGIIVRTRAEAIEKSELLSEAKQLIKQFEAVTVSPSEMNYNALRYRTENALFKRYVERDVIQNRSKQGIALYQQIDLLAWLKDNQHQIVYLPSGIELFIEELEAMTVIDIDSAAFKWQSQADDFSYAVNLAALSALPVELAKRKISGTVLIDCLSMSKEIQKRFKKEIRTLLNNHHIILKEMTKSGLLELSIQNSRPSIKQSFYRRDDKGSHLREEVLIDYWLDYMIYYRHTNQNKQFYFTVSRDIYYKMQSAQADIKQLLTRHEISLTLLPCEVAEGVMQPFRSGIDTIALNKRKTIDFVSTL